MLKTVTTPIFYVNAQPHIGHSYSLVLADAIHRWNLVKGHRSRLTTGTDEHGLKIFRAAQSVKEETGMFCNRVSELFRDLSKNLNINYSEFIRTTDEKHKLVVQDIWRKLSSNGDIYLGSHTGFYSIDDEAFYPLSDLEFVPAKQKYVVRGSPKIVEELKEECFKFKLSKYKGKIIDWIKKENPIIPITRTKEILMYLEKDEGDLCISRPSIRQPWGIPVPENNAHTIYVWIDALINYLTVSGYPKSITKNNGVSLDVQVIGKDIMRFHCIYWPALLLALNLPLPVKIISHGHWLFEGQKMSKSLGNVVDPTRIIEKYGSDALRYFLLLEANSLASDSNFSEESLHTLYESDLVNNLGNIFSRLFRSSIDYYKKTSQIESKVVAAADSSRIAEIKQLNDKLNHISPQVAEEYDKYNFTKGLLLLRDLLGHLNYCFNKVEPWKLANQEDKSEDLYCFLSIAIETLRIASICYYPVIPETSVKILRQLNQQDQVPLFNNAIVYNTSKLSSLVLSNKPENLFKKLNKN